MINAKAETIEQKPAYRHAFRYQRCLIPCDGFYEWHAVPTPEQSSTKTKASQPYYIYKKDRSLLAMAGIWDSWSGAGETGEPSQSQTITSFSIITTDANPLMEQIHHRMPVILQPGAFDNWLSNRGQDPLALKSLLVPYQSDDLLVHPVSKAVNSPKNDSVELIEAVNV
jgi:putative SOS response-associated peptidase YedK